MSTSTSSSNGTTIVTGPDVIQVSDFYAHAGILHPLIVGSIAVIVLFFYLRLGSNRSVAPITVFDWIINVALGSTLAGIVNGNSLVRGLIALLTMLTFQYITSHLSSHYAQRFEWIFHAPPLVIVFRGRFLHKTMAKHRISESDIYSALRQKSLLHVDQVEVIIIEANGTFSIFTRESVEKFDREAKALMAVPAYRALCEKDAGKETSDNSESENAQREKSAHSDDRGALELYDSAQARNTRPEGTKWNVRSVLPV